MERRAVAMLAADFHPVDFELANVVLLEIARELTDGHFLILLGVGSQDKEAKRSLDVVLDCSKIAFEIKFSRNSTVFRTKIVLCSQKSMRSFAIRKSSDPL